MVVVAEYLTTMTSYVGDKDSYIENFMTEVAGFAGCEIIRRYASLFVHLIHIFGLVV